jgi:hypothetical protein
MFTTYEVTLDAGSTDVIVLRLGKTQSGQQKDDDKEKGDKVHLSLGHEYDNPHAIVW